MALVRLACAGPGALAPTLIALLAGHVGCHPVGPPARRTWLCGATDDVTDTLEIAGPDSVAPFFVTHAATSGISDCNWAALLRVRFPVCLLENLLDISSGGNFDV